MNPLIITGGPWVVIMTRSEMARLTTNMLLGVLSVFVLNFMVKGRGKKKLTFFRKKVLNYGWVGVKSPKLVNM